LIADWEIDGRRHVAPAPQRTFGRVGRFRDMPEIRDSVSERVLMRLDVMNDELAEIAGELPDDLLAQLNAVFDAHTRALAALSDIVTMLAAEVDELKHW